MGDKSVRLSILGNNLDAKKKLDEIDEKAEDLARKHPELSIGINTAAAAEKLAVLRAELKKTRDDAGGNSKTSLKSVMAGVFDFASGGVSGGWDKMNLFQKAIAGVGLATGIAEPAVAGLTVIAAGLSAGVLSAGLGLGVFGLAAMSAFKQIAAANENGKKLTGGMGELQTELLSTSKAFNRFGDAAAPGIAEVFGKALQLIPQALKDAQPFLAPTEKALEGIIGSLGKGLSSSGFKSFMDAFAKDSGKNLTSIAGAIGHIVVGLGGVLRAFLPMSTEMTGGLDSLTMKFEKWGTTLSGHSGFKDLITEATQEGPKVASAMKNIGVAVKNLLGDMAGMTTFSNSTVLWDLLNPLTGIIKLLSGNPKLIDIALWGYAAYSSLKKFTSLKEGVQGIGKTLGSLSGPLTRLGTSLKILKTETVEGEEAQISFNMALLANPIFLIVAALVILGVTFYELWKHCAAFRDFWKAAWHDIEMVFDHSRRWIATAFDDVRHTIAAFSHDFTSYFDEVRGNLHRWWSDTINFGSKVLSFFEGLPNRILGYLGRFGSLLLNAGSALIQGLMSGIDHEAGALWSKITGIGGKISGVFKSALSIFSPSRVFMDHGKNIVLGLAAGIDMYAHLAETSVSHLAQRAINASAGKFPGGSSNNGVLQLEWVGGSGAESEIMTLLKKWIRVRGGDPGVLGR